jgi:hypothetical protein
MSSGHLNVWDIRPATWSKSFFLPANHVRNTRKTMTIEETASVLDAAADEVERGWVQGKYEDRDGNVCVLGAIVRVLTLRTSWTSHLWAVMDSSAVDMISRHLQIPRHKIAAWNDELPPTREGQRLVAETLRAAAQSCRTPRWKDPTPPAEVIEVVAEPELALV